VQTMQEIQANYQVFNDNDKRKINQLMAGMGYGDDIFAEADMTARSREAIGRGARVEYLTPDQFTQRTTEQSRPEAEQKLEAEQKQGAEQKPEAGQPKPGPEGEKPVSVPSPEPAEDRPPMTSGEVFREIGENAREAGRTAARTVGSTALSLLQRARAAAAAAATAFVEYSKTEPVSEDEKKEDVRSVTSYQDGAVNKDVASAREQAKVDEAVTREQMEDTATRTQQDKAQKKVDPDQIKRDINRMKDVGSQPGSGKDGPEF